MSVQKLYKGIYKPSKVKRTTLLELSECNNYARHPKITNRPGKFIVIKYLIEKHYGVSFFSEDKKYWYFKK